MRGIFSPLCVDTTCMQPHAQVEVGSVQLTQKGHQLMQFSCAFKLQQLGHVSVVSLFSIHLRTPVCFRKSSQQPAFSDEALKCSSSKIYSSPLARSPCSSSLPMTYLFRYPNRFPCFMFILSHYLDSFL